MAEYKAGLRKSTPSHERPSSGLPQSDLPGVHYLRKLSKWQVNYKGKYIGVFAAKEDAEKKWHDLHEQE